MRLYTHIQKSFALLLTLVYIVSIVGVAVYTCNHRHKSTIVAMSDGQCTCSCHHHSDECCASNQQNKCEGASQGAGLHAESDCCTIAVVALEIDQQPEQQKRSVEALSQLGILLLSTFVQHTYNFTESQRLYALASSPHVDISPSTPLIYQIACLRL